MPRFFQSSLCASLLIALPAAAQTPPLMALNEPETSLHPSLIAPLARLIAAAPTQVVVVTHSAELLARLTDEVPADELELVDLDKDLGETVVAGQGLLSRPAWEWGRR